MNINWKAIAIGFVIALILYIIGAFIGPTGILRSLVYTIAPISGGLTTVYINNGDYVDSIMNGGITGGMAGFISAFVILALFGLANTLMNNAVGFIIIVIIINAVTAFIIGGVLGLLGGIIGILIKGEGFEK